LEQAGSWLSRRVLAKVGARLQEHWEEENELGGEGTGVIWRWWDWVSSATFLDELGILSDGTLTLSTPHFLPPSSFHLALKSHNASVLRTDFEDTAFPCGICFENPKGSKCVQLPSCGCVL
jgi:E3 ubiquitin-protein ligase RNF14